MKKAFKFLLVIVLLSCSSFAHARGIIVYGDYEKVSKVADLPQNDDYKTNDGQHVDLGVKYTCFEIMWIPLYVENEPEAVLIPNPKTGTADYYSLTQAEANNLAKFNKIDLASVTKVPFWDAVGGKFVFVLLLIGLIIFLILEAKKKKQEKMRGDSDQQEVDSPSIPFGGSK